MEISKAHTVYIPVRRNVASDKTGLLKKKVEANPNLPTGEAVSVSLINLIDESTREKDGGQFVHVDGMHLAW